MKAKVFVTLKPSVFDPQGRTISEALHSMGYAGIGDVRQGKYFELEIDAASAGLSHHLFGEVRRRGIEGRLRPIGQREVALGRRAAGRGRVSCSCVVLQQRQKTRFVHHWNT